jgi:hypothetical protein
MRSDLDVPDAANGSEFRVGGIALRGFLLPVGMGEARGGVALYSIIDGYL